MPSIDLILAAGAMSLLFLRHIAVYKEPSKINYTPLVLGLGAAGAILHFLLYGAEGGEIAAVKESLALLGIGVSLAALMSVLSRSAASMDAYENLSRLRRLGEEVNGIRSAVETFSHRLEIVAQMENMTHEQLRSLFKEEIDALNVIQANQKLFVSKIESLLAQQHTAMEKFEEFTLTEVPGLDNIVHRHIDLLRIAEQDHFNQIKTILKHSSDADKEVADRLAQVNERINAIGSEGLGPHTLGIIRKELDRIVHEFGRQVHTIGAKSESIATALLENDAVIKGSREQSELIMQQMVLSSKQMREITTHSKELSDSFKPLISLLSSAQALYEEFAAAKGKLGELVTALEAYDREEYRTMRETLEQVAAEATSQMQLLSQTLERSKPAPIDTKSIQELAGRVKLQRSYIGENQE